MANVFTWYEPPPDFAVGLPDNPLPPFPHQRPSLAHSPMLANRNAAADHMTNGVITPYDSVSVTSAEDTASVYDNDSIMLSYNDNGRDEEVVSGISGDVTSDCDDVIDNDDVENDVTVHVHQVNPPLTPPVTRHSLYVISDRCEESQVTGLPLSVSCDLTLTPVATTTSSSSTPCVSTDSGVGPDVLVTGVPVLHLPAPYEPQACSVIYQFHDTSQLTNKTKRSGEEQTSADAADMQTSTSSAAICAVLPVPHQGITDVWKRRGEDGEVEDPCPAGSGEEDAQSDHQQERVLVELLDTERVFLRDVADVINVSDVCMALGTEGGNL
jgi:hypothetical protein